MSADLHTNDPDFVQMVILTENHQKAPLTRADACEIEKYIFYQISATHGKRPRFKGIYVFSDADGAIIINTHVDSVNWLKEVIRSYKQITLRITDIKNSPQYTAKVKADVSRLDSTFVNNLFDLLEAHNCGLQTSGWRFVKTNLEPVRYCPNKKATYATILIDDHGKNMLEKNGYKLFLGFSMITFDFLSRVKRSETTGRICNKED